MTMMMSSPVAIASQRQLAWRGRSGRNYALMSVGLDHFQLDDSALYLVAKGPLVLWVGSGDDLVGDASSRSRLRLALDCADRAFRVVSGSGEAERLTTIWDLEGAEPVSVAA